ncbi:hypothetical protein [Sorangium sp. So ce362]|uniref:hypothetical protein n=1 Tax=Sorangium sp. So ce362 TaxID=3133303 RepID=UPI003F644047
MKKPSKKTAGVARCALPMVGAVDGLPRFEPATDKSRVGTLDIRRAMPVALLDG